MAITVEGAIQASAFNANDELIVWPAAEVAGDKLLVAFSQRGSFQLTGGSWATFFANWDGTLVDSADPSRGGNDEHSGVAFIESITGADADIVCQDVGAGSTNNSTYAGILLRGAGTPALLSQNNTQSGVTITVGGGTAAVGDTIVWVLSGSWDTQGDIISGPSATGVGAITKNAWDQTRQGTGSGTHIYTATATATTIGAFTATSSIDDGWNAYAIVVPAAGGGGGPTAQTITGLSFVDADTFPLGAITIGALLIAGAVFADPDTFPLGAVSTGPVAISGLPFTDPETFPLGGVSQEGGPKAISGVEFVDADTFPIGSVSTGPVVITGAAFTDPDTFPLGVITANAPGAQSISGFEFIDPDIFPIGSVSAGPVVIVGAAFVDSDTFPLGAVTAPAPGSQVISGAAYGDPDSFPLGAVAVGSVVISGTHFVDADAFPLGSISIGGTTITGLPFVDPDSFGSGTITLGDAPDIITDPNNVLVMNPLGSGDMVMDPIGSGDVVMTSIKDSDMPILAEKIKDPNDIQPFSLDVSAGFQAGDSYASHEWINGSRLTINSQGRNGNILTAVLSGGVAPTGGVAFETITARVTTALGYRFDQSIQIQIKER